MSSDSRKVNITLRSYISQTYNFKNDEGVIGIYIDDTNVSVFVENKMGVTSFLINTDHEDKKWAITEEPREYQTNQKIRALRRKSESWTEIQVDKFALNAFKEDMKELTSKPVSVEKIKGLPLIAAERSRIELDFHEQISLVANRSFGH